MANALMTTRMRKPIIRPVFHGAGLRPTVRTDQP
jgi:hypothetical protein